MDKLVPIQTKKSTTNCVGDQADDVSEEETYTKPVKDISLETYTLQKLVMLDNDSIIADTDFGKIREFSYRQFDSIHVLLCILMSKFIIFGACLVSRSVNNP